MTMGTKIDIVVYIIVVTVFSLFSTHASCTTKTKAKTKTVVVNCNYQNLTAFPEGINEKVTELRVISNRISDIPAGALSRLVHLTHLNLSHNLLHEVNPRMFQGLWKLQSIDLSYNQLTVLHNRTFYNLTSLSSLTLTGNQIPSLNPASFEGVPHLLSLDLGENQLHELMNNTFCHLQELESLLMYSNKLNRLEAGTFYGLSKLVHLDISSNHIAMVSSALPPGVFAPLGKLEHLEIQNNSRGTYGSYPDGVFSDLASVRHLCIDTFSHMHFGKDFSVMRQVEKLDLSQNCMTHVLSNSSLEGFKNSTLSVLILSCSLFEIELCAFCHLPALKRLWIHGDRYTIPTKIIEALYGLQYQKMEEISLKHVGGFLPMYFVIDQKVARYLRNICVSTFKVVTCNIGRVVGGSLTAAHFPFTKCLEHADFSDNNLLGDTTTLLQLLVHSTRLRSLSVQSQQVFTFTRARCLVGRNKGCKEDMVFNSNVYMPTMILPCPKNLTYANFSSIFAHANPLPKNITIQNAAIRTLDLSYIGLGTCRWTFYGVDNLEDLSLEGNFCDSFEDTAFDFMLKLKTLTLSNMMFDQQFILTGAKRVFRNLVKLQVLSLAFNSFLRLSADMLQTQTELRELDLSGNRLQSVSIDLQYQRRLRRLDLSRNMLTTLTLSERQALDHLAGRHQFRLLLHGNPLACSCFNLELVLWLWSTPVLLDGDGRSANYTCTTENGEITSTEQVMVNWLGHWRHCNGLHFFSLALTAFVVQILGLIIVFFISRSWTQLYYAWKSIRNFTLPRRLQFPKDAYFVYADVDDDVSLACVTLRHILEDQYGVRLLLRNRDEVGGHIAENIVNHIDSSWKVVLLVTRTFSEDDWACGFAVTQAQRSITAQMPDRVIVLFFEDPGQLPAMPPLQMLLRMVPEKNVLYIHPGTPPDHNIWQILVEMILDEPFMRK